MLFVPEDTVDLIGLIDCRITLKKVPLTQAVLVSVSLKITDRLEEGSSNPGSEVVLVSLVHPIYSLSHAAVTSALSSG